MWANEDVGVDFESIEQDPRDHLLPNGLRVA